MNHMMASVTERWIYVAIGGWLVASPWILGFSNDVLIKWDSVLCGLVLMVMNVWVLTQHEEVVKK